MATINGKSYVVVIDEGFADGWREQIYPILPKDEQGDRVAGPIYIYKVDDVTTIVSYLHELTLDELKEIVSSDTPTMEFENKNVDELPERDYYEGDSPDF